MNSIKTFFTILLLISAQTIFAQKVFTEGTLKYKVNISGVADPQAQAMMQNMVMSTFIKNGKFATEMDMGMMKTRTIMQSEDKYVTLMDMMGQKFKYTMDKKQFEDKKLKDDNYEVTVTNDTKVIAGYNCKKAIIKTKDGNSFFAYFTDELTRGDKENYNGPYSKIKGMLMEYSMEKKGNTMTMTCTNVDFKPVSDDVFVIPETGYTEMTMDQIMKMGGM